MNVRGHFFFKFKNVYKNNEYLQINDETIYSIISMQTQTTQIWQLCFMALKYNTQNKFIILLHWR